MSHDEGGLPGLIKVFQVNTVIAPFCVMALLARGYRLNNNRINYMLAVIVGVSYVIGVMLRMDRLSMLALMPITVSIIRQTKSRAIRHAAVGGALMLISFIILQSIRRGSDIRLVGWVAIYIHLGMLNAGIMMNTVTQHTYGLAGVFSFVSWILRGFGAGTPVATYDYVWSTAQNGFGIMFEDFGWCGILFFMVGGIAGRHVDTRAIGKDKEYGPWPEIQSIFSYALLSIWTVPAYGGMEYWVLLFMSVMLVKRVIKRPTQRRRKEDGERRSVQRIVLVGIWKRGLK
jgi:hypothetical protein